jgi:SAM-dependent methyltransferase
MDELRLARSRSFSRVADAYERARPGYPEDAVEWLVGAEPCRVVDVGAGTGKLTRQLAALGHEATAVEPSAEMLAQLRAAMPDLRAVVASAEAIPLPDRSADAVVAAQAFHWFEPVASLREIARILRPRGRLGLIWNMRDDRVAWVAQLSELLGADGLGAGWPDAAITTSGRFGPLERETFAFEQTVDRETLQDLVASRSFTATREPDERTRLLEQVGALHDEHAVGGELVLPYVTLAFRARRR